MVQHCVSSFFFPHILFYFRWVYSLLWDSVYCFSKNDYDIVFRLYPIYELNFHLIIVTMTINIYLPDINNGYINCIGGSFSWSNVVMQELFLLSIWNVFFIFSLHVTRQSAVCFDWHTCNNQRKMNKNKKQAQSNCHEMGKTYFFMIHSCCGL